LHEIRIVLLGMRGILHDVLEAVLEGCPDLTVVAECSDPVDLQAAMDRSGAQVVVCGLDEAEAADVGAQVLEQPARVKVIAIQDDGRRAVIWELRPQRTELGNLSPRLLVEALRRVERP
jgi:DNA-binding NarL/FixJ family response regulator